MDTELFMECEEEELEPWQQVNDGVDEDDMDYMENDSSSPPLAAETPPIAASPLLITSFTPSLVAEAPPPVARAPPPVSQAPPLFLLPSSTQPLLGFPMQSLVGSGSQLVLNFGSGPMVRPVTLIHSTPFTSLVTTSPALPTLSLSTRPMIAAKPGNVLTQVGGASIRPPLHSGSANESRGSSAMKKVTPVVMSVEEFYYGCSEGLKKPRPLGTKPTGFICHLCSQLADNNLSLMQHMLLHSDFSPKGGGPKDSDVKTFCRFCYRRFSSSIQLQTHLYHVHGSAHCTTVCRMCEWAFDSQPSFLGHMKSHHKPGEMPYVCQVCSFRSSFYSDVIKHFSNFHKDTHFLMCVFCLRITKNLLNYTHHLLRHQVNQASHCNRCRLQFVCLKDKMQHKQENHQSFRRPAQLEGLPPGSKVTIRTYGKVRAAGSPASHIKPLSIKTEPVSPEPKRRCHRNRATPLLCLECRTDASDLTAHYPTLVRCLLCSYSSCCSRAYASHMIHHHVSRPKSATHIHRLHPPCAFVMRCSSCDYTPHSADQMAEHLHSTQHYSAVCKSSVYIEPDIQLGVEQPRPQDQDQNQVKDQYDPSWRLAQCWKKPSDGDGFSVVPFSQPSGPHHSLPKNSDAIDFFLLLFPAPLIELIADQTNSHAQRFSDPSWFPVTPLEVQGFLGLVVLMGIQILPNPEQYWSKGHYENSTTFSRTMSYSRFQKIAANIRMSSFASDQQQDSSDRLRVFRPMLELLGRAMWDAYRPNACLAVDRALLPPLEKETQSCSELSAQPEVWLLCDSKSGYCHRLLVRAGPEPGCEPGFSVVPELMEGLQNQQHQLFLSKTLLSAPLLLKLLQEGIYACSSFPPPGAALPAHLWTLGSLRRPGDFLQRRCGPLLVTNWLDTKEMCCLSTNAAAGQTDTVWRRSTSQVGVLQAIARPLAFRLLQENMRGVDICKQLLACNPLGGVPLDRHWRSLFWFLVNLSIVNAFIMLRESRRENPPTWVQDGLFTQLAFRRRLGNQLATCAQRADVTTASIQPKEEPQADKERHRIGKISKKTKRCKNCNLKNIRHESVYGCVFCKANLCNQPSCFWEYHGLSPSNKGPTKTGFLRDRLSGEVEVASLEEPVDPMMAPVEDLDFSDDDEDFDKEDLIEDGEHTASLTDEQTEADDWLGGRQLKMALFALCEGVSSASRFFSCDPATVRSVLSEARRNCNRAGLEGEEQMVLWVLSMWEQQLPITESALFHQASALKRNSSFDSAFRISYAWAVDFLLRYRLSPAPALSRELLPVLEEKVVSFKAFVQKIVRVHGLSLSVVAAVDELCVFVDWDLVQNSARRCDALRLTGTKPLLCVFLAVLANGTRLPALVVVKKQLEKRALPESVLLEVVSEDAQDEDALDIWMRRVWAPHVAAQNQPCKSLLILDQHREHTAEPFLSRLSEFSTLPALIPTGSSSHLQPLDVCVRPVLQNLLTNRWSSFSSSEGPDHQDQSQLAGLLVDWIVQALEDLDNIPDVWRSSFSLTGLLREQGEDTNLAERRTKLLRSLTEVLPGVDFSETPEEEERPENRAMDTQEDGPNKEDREVEPGQEEMGEESEKKCVNQDEDRKDIKAQNAAEEMEAGQEKKEDGQCLERKDERQKVEEEKPSDRDRHGEDNDFEVRETVKESPVKVDQHIVEKDSLDKKSGHGKEEDGQCLDEDRKEVHELMKDGQNVEKKGRADTKEDGQMDRLTNRRETRIVVGEDVGDEWKVTGTDGDGFELR
ncbi:pogo transposable element with ZNF domain [Gouania willdenowi]|uniref:Uncharacterized LOC114460123 n=1 Tax=Gouania willdenowi TaxID=441366 RepID=A0A8C5EMC6_GOUWI|nr:uncharacterized protein LOC114460123 [Gouania willdenowi]